MNVVLERVFERDIDLLSKIDYRSILSLKNIGD